MYQENWSHQQSWFHWLLEDSDPSGCVAATRRALRVCWEELVPLWGFSVNFDGLGVCKVWTVAAVVVTFIIVNLFYLTLWFCYSRCTGCDDEAAEPLVKVHHRGVQAQAAVRSFGVSVRPTCADAGVQIREVWVGPAPVEATTRGVQTEQPKAASSSVEGEDKTSHEVVLEEPSPSSCSAADGGEGSILLPGRASGKDAQGRTVVSRRRAAPG